MLLVSKSNPAKSDQFWLNFARISLSSVILLSLLLGLLTVSVKPDTVAVSGLFFFWSILATFGKLFWKRPLQFIRITAFIDLALAAMIIISYSGLSLMWLPAVFLLPVLEFSALYRTAGTIFVTVAFAWTIILSGLMNVALLQQPLWWMTALLWGAFILFTATLQALRPGHRHSIPLWASSRTKRSINRDKTVPSLPEEDTWNIIKGHVSQVIPQIATAFERPFRHMGVHTEEHRQEIEDAINALYSLNSNQEALSLCLDRLLQAAKQNWVGLAVFSPREQEILELLLQNCTYKEMSSRLHVSPSTIKTHIYHIFQKLDVSNRDEAMRLIRKRGWFPTNQQISLLVEGSSR